MIALPDADPFAETWPDPLTVTLALLLDQVPPPTLGVSVIELFWQTFVGPEIVPAFGGACTLMVTVGTLVAAQPPTAA